MSHNQWNQHTHYQFVVSPTPPPPGLSLSDYESFNWIKNTLSVGCWSSLKVRKNKTLCKEEIVAKLTQFIILVIFGENFPRKLKNEEEECKLMVTWQKLNEGKETKFRLDGNFFFVTLAHFLWLFSFLIFRRFMHYHLDSIPSPNIVCWLDFIFWPIIPFCHLLPIIMIMNEWRGLAESKWIEIRNKKNELYESRVGSVNTGRRSPPGITWW